MLASRRLAGPAIRLPGPRRLATVAGRLIGPRQRTLELELPADGTTLPEPPTYLASIADAAGVDIRGYRCALSAIGDYNTQKVLFLLRAAQSTTPAVVVKLTRHPSVNRRLETERDALRRLATYGDAIGGRVPRVLFSGRHAGLAVVGESALPGVPFADLTSPGGPDAAAKDALDWLTRLAVVSARPAAADAVAEALHDLHGRYVALCRPTAAEAARLADAIELVARSSGPFPVVVQHGDPGTWNLLVDDAGRVSFLDWENADAAGMPLWDVFYLLRSHAVGTARRAGVRRRLAGVERYLFGASPLSDSIVRAVGGYASQLRIDPALVEPLFHLCWMQQALKEATRTDPARVRDGHYNRLLRLGLERRTAPTLQRVFSGDGR
jgi:aminoglycoside phosphotransferase